MKTSFFALLLVTAPLAWAADPSPSAPARSAEVSAILEAIVKDPAAAFALALKGRDKGDAACTYLLGQMHEMGLGVPKADPAKAFSLYEEAAKAGVPEALSAVARCLENGLGTPVNRAKALFYWQQAAEANDPPALARIGKAEMDGDQRPASDSAALPWLEKAAAAKDPLGLWLLSQFHDSGRAGLPPGAENAVTLCAQAANLGNLEAMLRMGHYYSIGKALPKDPVAATGWFRLASDKGHIPATARLASCYLEGAGCVPDEVSALRLALAGAKAGDSRCQYLLGRIFDEGLGQPVNRLIALVYHLRAMQGGLSEAKTAVARIKAQLSPEEVIKAQSLADQADYHLDDSAAPPPPPAK